MKLVETAKIIGAAAPANYTGAAYAGQYVSLKNYGHLTIIIHTGAWAAGTAAVTLRQATDIAAGTNKALDMNYVWKGTVASGLLTKTAVVADTFDLDTANMLYVIEVDAPELDGNAAAPYDCMSVLIASPGANNDYYSVEYILSGARYEQATPPSAIVD